MEGRSSVAAGPLEQRHTFVLLQLLLVYCFLKILQDACQEEVAVGLELLELRPEALYFLEVADVYFFGHEQEFAVSPDQVGEVVVLGFAQLLEPENVPLV